MADLQDLLARLQSRTASRSPHPPTTSSYHQPAVSSEIPSPLPSGPQPHHASAIMSPNLPSASQSPKPDPSARSASLLSLLNSGPGPPAPGPAQSMPAGTETSGGASRDRPISASDLVASFMRKPSSSSLNSPTVASPGATKPGEVSASAGGSSQAYLLNLLNQAKPAPPSRPGSLHSLRRDEPIPSVEPSVPETTVDDVAQDLKDASLEHTSSSPTVERKPSPFRVFGSEEPGPSTAFESPQAAAKPGIFSYVNPFEQLSASSPRNRTPVPKPRSRPETPKAETLEPKKNHAQDGGQSSTRESVAQAVEGVGERVDKEVEHVLAQAETQEKAEATVPSIPADLQHAVQEGAAEIKNDLKDDHTREAVQDALGKDAAETLQEVVDDIAEAAAGESWENADAAESAKEDKQVVRVYNFPMRPFVSLEVAGDLGPDTVAFQHDAHLAVARMKKEFDQNDRALVDASDRYIAYVTPKTGGIRVISQEDGKYKNLFQDAQERVVNVGLCSTPKSSTGNETVLATGVGGSVFWAHLNGEHESFTDNLEQRSIIFPPFPVNDDNTSGGQLKTRARRSCRSPQFFAIGRGKSIHIVQPDVAAGSQYTNATSRVCNSERYLKEHTLKISTGKAGKDFAFSRCDTVIVSLDKTGVMKFWDIRVLTQPMLRSSSEVEPIEIKRPIMSLATASPSDKSWPTSVVFLDKERPFNKGIALRYLLVGMKQNHTLQLWDLCLQKAVQEINLPHENESDGICSVTYHPQSSIIAVGHPTRNSIYFIHLSAPRYLLPPMPQAKFQVRIADGDKSLPKVESTAIMTGIRELSFAPFGQLRSLESLSGPSTSGEESRAERVMFELYVMHSKGVARLNVKPEHMGWNLDDEVIQGIDAEKSGVVTLNDLKTVSSMEPSDASMNGDAVPRSVSGKSAVKESATPKKEASSVKPKAAASSDTVIARTLANVESKQDAARAAIINGTDKDKASPEKADNKKKKKKAADAASQASNAAPAPSQAPQTYARAAATPTNVKAPASPQKRMAPNAADAPEAVPFVPTLQRVPSDSIPTSFRGVDNGVASSVAQLFNKELDSLYRKFDEDKRVQDAAGAAKQDAVLRLVSSTLTENVEKSLVRIISEGLNRDLLPSLSNEVAGAVANKFKDVGHEVQRAVGMHHGSAVSAGMSSAMQDSGFQQSLGESIATRVSAHIDTHLTAALNKSITPAFTNLTVKTVQQIAADMEQRMGSISQLADAQRHNDSLKIDQLTNLVRSLSETVHTMAQAQTELRKDVQLLQRHVAASSPSSGGPRTATAQPEVEKPAPPKSEAEMEIDSMREFIGDGNIDGAMTVFVQSYRQVELFNALAHSLDPQYLRSVSSLVALSLAAALTEPLEPHTNERLSWMEVVLDCIVPEDAEIQRMTPKVMTVIIQRLQAFYMETCEQDKTRANPVLSRVFAVHRRALELKNFCEGGNPAAGLAADDDDDDDDDDAVASASQDAAQSK